MSVLSSQITYLLVFAGTQEALLQLDCMVLGEGRFSVSDYLPSPKFTDFYGVGIGNLFIYKGLPRDENDLINFAEEQGNIDVYKQNTEEANIIYTKVAQNLAVSNAKVGNLRTGNLYSVGEVAVGTTQAVTFNIANTSEANALNLTGSPLVDYAGDGDIVVSSQLRTNPLPAEGSDSFELTFTPTGVGNFNGVVTIESDDAAGVYQLRVAVVGVAP